MMVTTRTIRPLMPILLVAILVFPAYTHLVLQPAIEREMLVLLEQEAKRIARHLFLSLLQTPDRNLAELTIWHSPQFQQRIDDAVRSFELYKLRFFSAEGSIVYSTLPSEIGQRNDSEFFHRLVASGKEYSKVVQLGEPSREGERLFREVAETYVPVMANDRFLGAIEIYYDISAPRNAIERLHQRTLTIHMLVATLLFVGLTYLATRVTRLSTRHRQSEEALSAVRNRQELTLAALGEGVYGVDTNGITTFANPAALKLLGFTWEELRNANSHRLFHHTTPDGEEYDESLCPIYQSYRDRMLHRVSHDVFWRKDGSSIAVEYTSTPLIEEGEVQGAVVVFRDITRQREQEKQLRRAKETAESANRAKSIFLANMSHELRTPLNGLLGRAQNLLRSPTLDPALGEEIGQIQRNADTLLRLLNDLLDLSRSERGELSSHQTECNPHAMLGALTDQWKHAARQRGVRFEYHSHGAIPERIYCDEMRFRQILFDLPAFAIGRSGNRGVQLDLTWHDDRLACAINDSGPPLDDEQLATLFEPFAYNLEENEYRNQGTRLEAAIARRLIALLGGELQVSNRAQGGCHFQFELPLTVTDSATGPVPGQPPASTALDTRPLSAAQREEILALARLGKIRDIETFCKEQLAVAATPELAHALAQIIELARHLEIAAIRRALATEAETPTP